MCTVWKIKQLAVRRTPLHGVFVANIVRQTTPQLCLVAGYLRVMHLSALASLLDLWLHGQNIWRGSCPSSRRRAFVFQEIAHLPIHRPHFHVFKIASALRRTKNAAQIVQTRSSLESAWIGCRQRYQPSCQTKHRRHRISDAGKTQAIQHERRGHAYSCGTSMPCGCDSPAAPPAVFGRVVPSCQQRRSGDKTVGSECIACARVRPAICCWYQAVPCSCAQWRRTTPSREGRSAEIRRASGCFCATKSICWSSEALAPETTSQPRGRRARCRGLNSTPAAAPGTDFAGQPISACDCPRTGNPSSATNFASHVPCELLTSHM